MTKTILAVLALFIAVSGLIRADESGKAPSKIEQGKELAFSQSKGNCLACHAMAGGALAGNFGPPLVMMKARFPDREVLRAQIWDAGERTKSTVMPPFGRHMLLTEEEIDLVVDFVLTL